MRGSQAPSPVSSVAPESPPPPGGSHQGDVFRGGSHQGDVVIGGHIKGDVMRGSHKGGCNEEVTSRRM